MHNTKKKLFNILVYIIIFLCGFYVGSYMPATQATDESQPIRQSTRQYTYIHPLLGCDIKSDHEEKRLAAIESAVTELRSNLIHNERRATDISVYFRDSLHGGAFGIKENDQFTPASLLKVPLLIAYLKQADRDPSFLSKKLTFTPNPAQHILDQNIKPAQTIEYGKEYTVDELLRRMIADSDNNAQTLLFNSIHEATVSAVYSDLGIDIPGMKSTENYMSVKEYASFFRVLFSSTYLSREMSEKALELLATVDYDDGIRASIPEGIMLANKFGERRLIYEEDGHEVLQLHDCGIVYYPQKPYLLCIMTRGDSFEDLTAVIRHISQKVFEEVSKL